MFIIIIGLSSSTNIEHSCTTSIRAPLAGIVPLFSEETVGYDSDINKKSSLNRNKKKKLCTNNKENSGTTQSKKNITKPLGKLDNIRNIHLFEKRSSNDSSQTASECKRHRSS